MPFTFIRHAGMLLDTDGKTVLCQTAYSGHGEGVNNPEMEGVPNVGPIPAGTWTIGPPRTPVDHLGPVAMPLTPAPGTETYGRTAFFIHGDNARMNHSASDGCVILPRVTRDYINGDADDQLTVV